MSSWSGRRVRRLVNLTLLHKGTICHLCTEDGADSADHDPPRSQLLAEGIADPDALEFLFPAHRVCNNRRQARPITFELLTELQAKRQRDHEISAARATLSPRFQRTRPTFLSRNGRSGSPAPSLLSLDAQEKPGRAETRQ